MHSLLRYLTLATLAMPAAAQLTLVAPVGFDNTVGNSNNIFPWGRGTSAMRFQQVYDSSNFTLQGVSAPVLIQGMRFRPFPGATFSWTGGTWSNVRIDLASCPLDFTAVDTTFANNLHSDVTTVLNGPVTVNGGTTLGTGVVVPWHLDIPLTTPFLYDPTAGLDLTMDVHLDGVGWTGTARGVDVVSGTAAPNVALGSRIYNTTSVTATTGTITFNYSLICEFTYVPAAGYATSTPYGQGCIDRASATFYELFPNGTFDLSNTSLQMLPTGNGYLAIPGGNQWWPPVGANLGLIDDSVSAALPLGFTLNYPGGSTNAIYASSNGFVWAQPSINNGCCVGDPGALRSDGARWAALWNDLNPGIGGTVIFDTDPANGVAYLTFSGVPEFGLPANLNTFQYAFYASGVVEMRWQNCAVTARQVLVGWSPGGGTRNPGSIDISATPVILTEPDQTPLALAAGSRPVLGTTVALNSSQVPANTAIGATLLGLVELNPSLPLTPLGMPGCFQHLNVDATAIWLPTGTTGSTNFPLPNNPGLAGVVIRTQSAALVPGINPVGAITSNALRLQLDLN